MNWTEKYWDPNIKRPVDVFVFWDNNSKSYLCRKTSGCGCDSYGKNNDTWKYVSRCKRKNNIIPNKKNINRC